ncbi:MAG: class I SAM-dependent methyltransferase [Mariniphaga sp.]|nr:class I SAM-dependent methyltransferase [Mariniphaga sp.]
MENQKENSQHQFSSREKIPNAAFRVMTGVMGLFDLFGNHSNNKFKTLGLKPDQTVIDYGCGPARYIKNASLAVGESGRVIAVDIHPKAIDAVNSKITKYSLKNVEPVLANGYSTDVPNQTADVVYALDMFHMVQEPTFLLKELHRMLKPDGTLILEDGHQARSKTLQKINDSKIFDIAEENKLHVKCKPA